MRTILMILLFTVAAGAQQHCGYDFTSYIVLHVHEDGKKENIADLKITLADSAGNDVVNSSNKYSWKSKDEVLHFSRNYKIDHAGNRVGYDHESTRWFFPFAKDVWLLSVTNEFPADQMRVKISDPKGKYEDSIIQLYAFNMYVLCTSQAQQQAMQFGRRVNKPVDVVLKKLMR